MSNTLTLEQAEQLPTACYAPEFTIEIDKYQLDTSTKGDILSLRVDMDIDNLDRFDFTVNNWDDSLLDVKYSDRNTFNVGNLVTINMGYANRLVTVMRGEIVSLTPRFPESGSPTLSIAGNCSLNKLRGRKPKANEKKFFPNMADYQIAEEIARRNGLEPVVDKIGPIRECIWQRDLDDAMFLMERAKSIDFDLFVQADPDSGKESLYFIKPKDLRDSSQAKVFVFEYGVVKVPSAQTPPGVLIQRNLMSFSPRLNASRQVSSVTVRGWDPKLKKPIEATANAKDLPHAPNVGETGPDIAGKKGDQVVDASVTTQAEAVELAKNLLLDKAYSFVTGEGRVIGVPDLRPGNNVDLRGLGKRFSGNYYVKSVSHSIGSDGFTTTFSARRWYDGIKNHERN